MDDDTPDLDAMDRDALRAFAREHGLADAIDLRRGGDEIRAALRALLDGPSSDADDADDADDAGGWTDADLVSLLGEVELYDGEGYAAVVDGVAVLYVQADALGLYSQAVDDLANVRAEVAPCPMREYEGAISLARPRPKAGAVRRYRVTAASRVVLAGIVHTVAEGTILSRITHDLDAYRAQGVPMMPIEG